MRCFINRRDSRSTTTYPPASQRRLASVLSGLLLIVLAAPLHAIDISWVAAPPIGIYDDATSWDPDGSGVSGIPNATDNVTFGVDQTSQVFLGGPSLSNNVNVTAGNWTFTGGAAAGLTSSGAVTIDSASTNPMVTLTNGIDWLANVGAYRIGELGQGELHLTNGAVVTHNGLRIGNQAGSDGLVTVDGASSFLGDVATPNLIQVGDFGTGQLDISGTADARASQALIGVAMGSMGTVNITGTGSTLITGIAGGTATDNRTAIGRTGTGIVNITAGGSMSVSNARDTILGQDADGSGTIFIDAGSFSNADTLEVGRSGDGTITVQNGGTLASAGSAILGVNALSEGSVIVDDSTFSVGFLAEIVDNLVVGGAGKGTFNVQNGGTLTVENDTFIGNTAGNLNANKLTVTGAGSTATLDSVTYVGSGGNGALEVSAGAAVTTNFLRVGQFTGATGVLVVTSGATLTANNDTVFGTDGVATFTVSAGGQSINDFLYIGFDDGSAIGTVTGRNSLLRAGADEAGDLFLGGASGQTGGVAQLTVAEGATLRSGDESFIGGNTTGHGRLIITGVNDNGTPQTDDDLRSTADFEDNAAGVAANDITNIGSVGNARVEILSGGTMISERVIVEGAPANATLFGVGVPFTETVLVNGAFDPGTPGDPNDDVHSTLQVLDGLTVGNTRGSSLRIENGGRVISSMVGASGARASIGEGAAADGSSVVIDGTGSNWTHAGSDVSVAQSGGDVANPVMLTIQNGGSLNGARILIADATGSRGIATVTGAGSRLDASTDLFVGDQAVGFLNVTAGGVAQALGAVEVGGFAAGNGTVLVDGAGSRLISAGYLSLGDSFATSAAVGLLTVQNGGTVDTGTAFVGRYTFGNGTAHVNNGGTWNVGTSMYVAGDVATASGGAGTGVLNVNTGGLVDVNATLKVWSNGIVNLNGGTIEANALDVVEVGTPQFNFNSGTFRFASTATLNADTLEDLLGASPTLTAGKHLAVVNTAAFSAPLRVNGGTLSFGNVTGLENVDFDAGTINVTDVNVIIGAAGLFGPTLVIDSDQTINVTNAVSIHSAAHLIVAGAFSSGGLTNQGDLTAIDATIGGPVTNNTAVTVVGTVDFNGLVSGPGDFFGPGTANFNGGMAPGSSPGEVHFEGNLALADTNTLFIEIAGTTPGSLYDRLVVAGSAALDGILDVSLDGFSPSVGQQFTILTASSIVDNGLVLGGTAANSFNLLVGSTNLILQAITAGQPGDYNQNGIVDAADYTVWRDNLGGLASLPNDNTAGVGPDDYQRWKTHFGESAGSGAGASSRAAVPEPATLALFVTAIVAIAFRRWD
ncbi:MAG: PEP-CTERM sorting domain-containing protein [Pirellulales bacterium]